MQCQQIEQNYLLLKICSVTDPNKRSNVLLNNNFNNIYNKYVILSLSSKTLSVVNHGFPRTEPIILHPHRPAKNRHPPYCERKRWTTRLRSQGDQAVIVNRRYLVRGLTYKQHRPTYIIHIVLSTPHTVLSINIFYRNGCYSSKC